MFTISRQFDKEKARINTENWTKNDARTHNFKSFVILNKCQHKHTKQNSLVAATRANQKKEREKKKKSFFSPTS